MSYTTKSRKIEVERNGDNTQPDMDIGDIVSVKVGVTRRETGRNGSAYSREVQYTVSDGIASVVAVGPLYPNPDEWEHEMKVRHMGEILAVADNAVGKVPEVEAVRSLADVLVEDTGKALEDAKPNVIARPPDDVTVGIDAFKVPNDRPGEDIAGTDYPVDTGPKAGEGE